MHREAVRRSVVAEHAHADRVDCFRAEVGERARHLNPHTRLQECARSRILIRLRPEHRNHVWSYDFVEHRTHDGRKFRTLNVVDEFTRECLAIRVARKLKAVDRRRATLGAKAVPIETLRVAALGWFDQVAPALPDAIVEAVVTAAKGGDPTAMRLCIERLIPVRRGRPITFPLPALKTADDVGNAIGTIVQGMARGELTPDEAGAVAAVVELRRKAIETSELEKRIAALEQPKDPTT